MLRFKLQQQIALRCSCQDFSTVIMSSFCCCTVEIMMWENILSSFWSKLNDKLKQLHLLCERVTGCRKILLSYKTYDSPIPLDIISSRKTQ